ncbi:MAG: hypothetical protein JWL88_763 [Parcubacteria group bacterium]|nr:hypothetical protein [Parcubacteria group bacterium]
MEEGSEVKSDILERLDVLSDLIEENIKLAKDTNRIIRDVRRTGRIAFWCKLILWVLVLATPLFFIGPILQYFKDATGLAIPSGTNVFGVPSAEQIQSAITQYKAQNSVQK